MAHVRDRPVSVAGEPAIAAPPVPAATVVPPPEGLAALLERLRLLPTGAWCVSAYVSLTPEDRAGRRYLGELKARISEARAGLDGRIPERALRETAERDLDRVADTFRDAGALPHARGAAVFACEAAGLLTTVGLPQVDRPRVLVDRTPLVRGLVEAEAESAPTIVAVADRGHARIFEVTPFGVTELPTTISPARPGGRYRPDREDAPGAGERRYHQRITREKEQHYAEVTRTLGRIARTRGAGAIVLAAPGPEAAALARFLDPEALALLAGSARLAPKAATPDAVLRFTERLLRRRRGEEVGAALALLADDLGTGWAVNGLAPALEALSLGSARMLFVGGGVVRPGFRCPESGRLVVRPEDCVREGTAQAVPDVIDDAVEEAWRQEIPVVFARGADARRIDGLAARLRFR